MNKFFVIILLWLSARPLCAVSKDPCQGIMLNAEPFGYGPAAAVAQIAVDLRDRTPRLGYMGEGHTVDLQKRVGYDDIVQIKKGASDAEIRSVLRQNAGSYSHFFSALDFRYAVLARDEGYRVGVYDPLTWYWKSIPPEIKNLELYIAQNFIGVSDRINEKRSDFPAKTLIIPPIVPNPANGHKISALVNFGGLSNPYIADEVMFKYSAIVLKYTHEALMEVGLKTDVVGNPRLGMSAGADGFVQMKVQTLSPEQIRSKLSSSKIAIMTSGLGNIYEAAAADTYALWLPPVNDSQGQQIEILKRRDFADAWVDWSDFTDEGKIDYFSDQSKVMEEIKKRMLLTINNESYQRKLQSLLRQKIFAFNQNSSNKLNKLSEKFGTGGAVQLVESIAQWLKPTITNNFNVAGNLSIVLNTTSRLTPSEIALLNAHIPDLTGCSDGSCLENAITVQLNHAGNFQDLLHQTYGLARRAWIKNNIFPVHGACVGNAQDGYSLLVGPSGSGKTSVVRRLLEKSDNKLFSGDKTLVKIAADGTMEAIAGTRIITIRDQNLAEWQNFEFLQKFTTTERTIAELAPTNYVSEKSVKISRIYLLDVNGGVQLAEKIGNESALHTLYPFFLDRHREDIILEGDGFVDGSTPLENRKMLAQRLKTSLQEIPVFKLSSSLDQMANSINEKILESNSAQVALKRIKVNPKKIVMGICGIGNGHLARQMPILKHLLDQGHHVIVLVSEGRSDVVKHRFTDYSNLMVFDTANPFFVGGPGGIDFMSTASNPRNVQTHLQINAQAMHQINVNFGTADLVITDYELVSAQFGYAKSIPVVTLDQQSKYLVGEFPSSINGTTALDELERLKMFFPVAKRRIALSFFKFENAPHSELTVALHAPILRASLIEKKGTHSKSSKPSLVVYMSQQDSRNEKFLSWIKVLESRPDFDMNIFLPGNLNLPADRGNLNFFHHGDDRFDDLLVSAHGVVSTAGHGLLSEAMFLEIPVLAVPLAIFEQQMNASVIQKNGFGMSRTDLSFRANASKI